MRRSFLAGFGLAILLGLGIAAAPSSQPEYTVPGPTGGRAGAIPSTMSMWFDGVAGYPRPAGNDYPFPVAVTGTVTSAPSGAPQPVTQSGSWSMGPATGVPVASAVTSVGTTAVTVFAAGAGLRYKLIQNQSTTAALYCRHDGTNPTAAPPAFMIQPLQVWGQGQSPGFVTSAAVICITASGTNPIAAWSAS